MTQRITFGIEVETTITSEAATTFGVNRGRWHAGSDVPESAMPHYQEGTRENGYTPVSRAWKASYDSTVRTRSNRRIPMEMVSPVMVADEAGFRHAHAAIKGLRTNLQANANSSCGTHVHVSFPVGDGAAFRRLCCIVANFERALFATTGSPSREEGNWCRSLKNEHAAKMIRGFKPTEMGSVRDAHSKTGGAFQSRYRIINIRPILDNRFATVEFRLFSGSANPDRILAWARLCVALVEYAVNGRKALKWDSDSDSSKYYKGEGRAELKRLYYRLGWIKGQNNPCRGHIAGLDDGETQRPDLSIAKCRKTLYDLADKYDARRAGTLGR